MSAGTHQSFPGLQEAPQKIALIFQGLPILLYMKRDLFIECCISNVNRVAYDA